MKPSTSLTFSALIVVLVFAVTAWLYPELPERMPTHWDAAGRADGFSDKASGAWLLPLVTAGIAGLLAALPHVSPRGYTLEAFRGVFGVLSAIVIGFFAFVQLLILSEAAGLPLSIERWLPAGIGLLLALLGNFFGKTTKNFFVGIRTPWTLANDEVWLRTHRLGGKLFVAAGAIVFASALAGRGFLAIPVAVGFAALVPIVYSYWLYRRIEGFGSDAP